MTEITPIPPKPRQIFDDNMEPARLLLRFYRMLDSNDKIVNDGDMVTRLRQIAQAAADEELLLVYNDLFMGLVRERADVKRSHLLERSLTHLLRQAVVTSCTALETYLPALLRANMPIVIQARGRNFLPPNDGDVTKFFDKLSFSLEEVLRLRDDLDAATRISNKILGYVDFNYLSSKKGIHLVGALLGIESPWKAIASHLGQDAKMMMDNLEKAVDRRNDIVHRADRAKGMIGGDRQGISYVRTREMVDTVDHICLALDELVTKRMAEFATVTNADSEL